MGDLLAGGMLEQARQIRELMAERDALRAQVQRQAKLLADVEDIIADGTPDAIDRALRALDAAQATDVQQEQMRDVWHRGQEEKPERDGKYLIIELIHELGCPEPKSIYRLGYFRGGDWVSSRSLPLYVIWWCEMPTPPREEGEHDPA